jgi:hypothetical protein
MGNAGRLIPSSGGTRLRHSRGSCLGWLPCWLRESRSRPEGCAQVIDCTVDIGENGVEVELATNEPPHEYPYFVHVERRHNLWFEGASATTSLRPPRSRRRRRRRHRERGPRATADTTITSGTASQFDRAVAPMRHREGRSPPTAGAPKGFTLGGYDAVSRAERQCLRAT